MNSESCTKSQGTEADVTTSQAEMQGSGEARREQHCELYKKWSCLYLEVKPLQIRQVLQRAFSKHQEKSVLLAVCPVCPPCLLFSVYTVPCCMDSGVCLAG